MAKILARGAFVLMLSTNLLNCRCNNEPKQNRDAMGEFQKVAKPQIDGVKDAPVTEKPLKAVPVKEQTKDGGAKIDGRIYRKYEKAKGDIPYEKSRARKRFESLEQTP